MFVCRLLAQSNIFVSRAANSRSLLSIARRSASLSFGSSLMISDALAAKA